MEGSGLGFEGSGLCLGVFGGSGLSLGGGLSWVLGLRPGPWLALGWAWRTLSWTLGPLGWVWGSLGALGWALGALVLSCPSTVRLLREELQLLQEQGSYVGEVVRAMDKKKVLVKVRGDRAGLGDSPVSPGDGTARGHGVGAPCAEELVGMALLGLRLPRGVQWGWSSWLLPGHGDVPQQGIPREMTPGALWSFTGAPRGEVCGGCGQEHRHQ